jgi:hypothetical protein
MSQTSMRSDACIGDSASDYNRIRDVNCDTGSNSADFTSGMQSRPLALNAASLISTSALGVDDSIKLASSTGFAPLASIAEPSAPLAGIPKGSVREGTCGFSSASSGNDISGSPQGGHNSFTVNGGSVCAEQFLVSSSRDRGVNDDTGYGTQGVVGFGGFASGCSSTSAACRANCGSSAVVAAAPSSSRSLAGAFGVEGSRITPSVRPSSAPTSLKCGASRHRSGPLDASEAGCAASHCKCGHVFLDAARFCHKCGTPRPLAARGDFHASRPLQSQTNLLSSSDPPQTAGTLLASPAVSSTSLPCSHQRHCSLGGSSGGNPFELQPRQVPGTGLSAVRPGTSLLANPSGTGLVAPRVGTGYVAMPAAAPLYSSPCGAQRAVLGGWRAE